MQLTEERGGYRPGICNIGTTEIAQRRRAGHAGAVATLILLLTLVAIDAPTPWRVILFLPAAAAASGYLQAAFRFCAGFGWAGVFNFGDELRRTETVEDAAARAADRRKALQIAALSAMVGVATVVAALMLPI